MTGVSPVTMDDLTSGFNIAANISQDRAFNAMLGFTTEETLSIYRDFKGVGEYREGEPEEIVRSIKPWYDGYCFASEKVGRESVFNSDMVLYHLKHLVAKGRPPENMVDRNIATDYDKLETIVELQRQSGAQYVEDVNPLTEELASGMAYRGEWEPFLRRLAEDFANTTPIRGDMLAKDTRLHLILYQFKGTELTRLEEISASQG